LRTVSKIVEGKATTATTLSYLGPLITCRFNDKTVSSFKAAHVDLTRGMILHVVDSHLGKPFTANHMSLIRLEVCSATSQRAEAQTSRSPYWFPLGGVGKRAFVSVIKALVARESVAMETILPAESRNPNSFRRVSYTHSSVLSPGVKNVKKKNIFISKAKTMNVNVSNMIRVNVKSLRQH
jgi:hypothetical protein